MTIPKLLPEASTVVGPDDYRNVISRLPTGVAVITAPGAEGPVGCTANAVMSLSTAPPSLLLSLTTSSRTLTQIREFGMFAINVVPHSDHALAKKFATGSAAERFAGVSWEDIYGVPVLTRSSVSLVNTVWQLMPVLDHTLVVGTVNWTRTNDVPPTVLYDHKQYAVGN